MPEPRVPYIPEPGCIVMLCWHLACLDEEYQAALGVDDRVANQYLKEWGDAMGEMAQMVATTIQEFNAKAFALVGSITTHLDVEHLEDDHGVGASLVRDLVRLKFD